jgi:hypothetical protein
VFSERLSGLFCPFDRPNRATTSVQKPAGSWPGKMVGVDGLRLRLRLAQAHWPELGARQRLAMVAWVIGLTELAALLMRL